MNLSFSFFIFIMSFFDTGINKKAESVLIRDIDYVDGIYYFQHKIFNGDIIDYYQNEKLKFRYAVLDGRLNGPAKEFFDNGEVKSERTYYMSKLYGSFIEYFPTGEIRAKFDVKLNAYGQGEIVEQLTIGQLKNGRYKSKDFDKGIIYFLKKDGKAFDTSENISILNQTKYKIMDEEKKKVLIKVE